MLTSRALLLLGCLLFYKQHFLTTCTSPPPQKQRPKNPFSRCLSLFIHLSVKQHLCTTIFFWTSYQTNDIFTHHSTSCVTSHITAAAPQHFQLSSVGLGSGRFPYCSSPVIHLFIFFLKWERRVRRQWYDILFHNPGQTGGGNQKHRTLRERGGGGGFGSQTCTTAI